MEMCGAPWGPGWELAWHTCHPIPLAKAAARRRDGPPQAREDTCQGTWKSAWSREI